MLSFNRQVIPDFHSFFNVKTVKSAVFVLKFSSLLKFQETRNKDEFPSNMHSLFKVKNILNRRNRRKIQATETFNSTFE